jgi:tRNA A37 threonylcarbamoyladenosine modification protein TsaB
MILLLNTVNDFEIVVGISRSFDNIEIRSFPLNQSKKSDILLDCIDQFLVGAGGDLHDLRGIVVCLGPGSFSSVRIGVTVANSIGFALKISVRGILKEEWEKNLRSYTSPFVGEFFPVVPYYESGPNVG